MPTLNIKAEMADFEAMYKNNPSRDKMHALIIGDKGAGKTRLIETCPGPVFVFSFDPDGCKSVQAQVEEGKVVVDTRYEADEPQPAPGVPAAYSLFMREFNRLRRPAPGLPQGFLGLFGTVVLDSLTTLSNSLEWAILRNEGRVIPPVEQGMQSSFAEKGGVAMRMPDWRTFRNEILKMARCFNTLPCHTIMMGHILREQNENTLAMDRTLMIPGKSKTELPMNTSEVYHLMVQKQKDQPKDLPVSIPKCSDGMYRALLTINDGEFKGGTRMGGHGKLNVYEPPHIKNILKKAGYPYEDKPSLQEQQAEMASTAPEQGKGE